MVVLVILWGKDELLPNYISRFKRQIKLLILTHQCLSMLLYTSYNNLWSTCRWPRYPRQHSLNYSKRWINTVVESLLGRRMTSGNGLEVDDLLDLNVHYPISEKPNLSCGGHWIISELRLNSKVPKSKDWSSSFVEGSTLRLHSSYGQVVPILVWTNIHVLKPNDSL